MSKERFVVIGGDAAGMSAASLAKRRRPDLEIEAFEMGVHTSYGACGMPYYIGGAFDDLDNLVVVSPDEFREKRGIMVHMRHRVEKIVPDDKLIVVRDLEKDEVREASYDELLIATGAAPIVPPGIDVDLRGVFTLRGLPDAGGIKNYIRENSCRTGLVIGKGYIGLEMAEALAAAGVKVTVMARRDRPMPNYEEPISAAISKELERQEVEALSGAEVESMSRPGDKGIQVNLSDGRSLTVDIVIVGAGVRPRSELAEDAGLKVGVKKAVWVDRRQRTSAPHIWSAGDCSEAYHRLLGKNSYLPLALGANRQGRIVGSNISGIEAEFPGILGTSICKIFDLTVARTGLGTKEAESLGLETTLVEVTARSRPHYYPGSSQIQTVLIVEKKNQKLWGAQMAGLDGVDHRINTWAAALGAGMSLEDIYGLDLAYAPPYSPVWDPVLVASEIAMKKVK